TFSGFLGLLGQLGLAGILGAGFAALASGGRRWRRRNPAGAAGLGFLGGVLGLDRRQAIFLTLLTTRFLGSRFGFHRFLLRLIDDEFDFLFRQIAHRHQCVGFNHR